MRPAIESILDVVQAGGSAIRILFVAIAKFTRIRGALLSGVFVASFAWNLHGTDAMAFDVVRHGTHLVVSGDIDSESPASFNRHLVETILELALAGDQDSPIHLHLDLPRGGEADASLKLVELMRRAQSHGTRFVAHVDAGSTCMSGCTFMFLAADERWMAPEARLIFHGFSQSNPERPVEVPQEHQIAYRNLLRSASTAFYRFFEMARIIEDDRKVGFTGKTLFEQKAFTGLVTGLTPRLP